MKHRLLVFQDSTFFSTTKQVVPYTPIHSKNVDELPYNPDEFNWDTDTIHLTDKDKLVLLKSHLTEKDLKRMDSLRNDSAFANQKQLIRVYKSDPYIYPNIIEKHNFDVSKQWIFILFLISLSIVAWGSFINKKVFNTYQRALIFSRESQKAFDNVASYSNNISLLLNFNFYMQISLFGLLVLKINQVNIFYINDFVTYIILLAGFVLLYSLKTFVINFIGYVVKFFDLSKNYIKNFYLYNKALGVVLIIVNMLIAYSVINPIVIERIGFGVIILFYLLRLFRGLQIFIDKGVSFFYMILYLCGLEILPNFLIFKYLAIKIAL